jgi:hypothetical protein
VAIERLHDPSEVEQTTTEPVDFVDDHAVHSASLDVRHQSPQGGAVHIATRKPTIVVAIRKALPALVTLADDVSLARFTLGVERVELLVESFFRGLPGVDRAADDVAMGFVAFVSGPGHRAPSLPSRKK